MTAPARPYAVDFNSHDGTGRGLITSFSGEHAFLSNFYDCPFEVKGLVVPTAEHAYQAQKTLDPYARAGILQASTPGQAKRLGRTAPMRPGWEDGLRVEVMREILRWKFASANAELEMPPLSVELMKTGDKHLVEGNTWGDTFWGCVQPKGNTWVGSNMLGILLMQRRAQLQTEIPY